MTVRIIEDHHLLDQLTLRPVAVARQILERVRPPARAQFESVNNERVLRVSTLPCADPETLAAELRRIRGLVIGLAAAEGCFCCAYGPPAELTVITDGVQRTIPALPSVADIMATVRGDVVASVDLSVREAIELTRKDVPVAPVVRRSHKPGPGDERLLREVPPHH